VAIATWVLGLLQEGQEAFTHAEVAAATGRSVTAVQDALRRLRGLGLLDWRHDFKTFGGRRRQTANHYWLCQADDVARPRPDLRRHRAGVHRPSREFKKAAYERLPWVGNDLLLARQRVIERRLRLGGGLHLRQ
jgi:hypothetical protein